MYRYLIILPLLLLTASACEDILDEEPRDLIDPGRFYQSETDGIAAIAGIYSHLLNNNTFGIQMDIYFNVNTDLLSPTRVLGAGQQFMGYRWDATTERFRVVWRELYEAVNDANLTIARIPEADFDEDAKNRIVAEATFLRAFIYYYLTAMYGDVPLILEPTTGDNFLAVGERARTPVAEIRDQIIADCQLAEQFLPETADQYRARATRWAAKALKMKTYLWQEDYAGAKAAALDIIDNSPHRLLDNFADIFDPANEFNDEIIFTLDFVSEEVQTNRHSRYEPRAQDEPNFDGSTRPFQFEGFGFFTVYKSVVNTFAENDIRRQSLFTEANGIETTYTYLYKRMRIDEPRGNSGLNYNFFRFADVLLNLAEAENELNGPTDEALGAINEVRARANLDPLEGLSEEELRQAIRQERIWELIGEGNHRKMDLLRWGLLGEALQNRLQAELAEPDSPPSLQAVIQLTADNFAPHKVVGPIPSAEILLNPNLTQNQGY